MSEQVYVCGHRNPDTDSICSSIAYASLKRRLGMDAVPVRLGNINKETEFVLHRFGVAPPPFLATVRTQVSDLDIDIVRPVTPEVPIKAVWELMQRDSIKTLPVVGAGEKLLGIVTLSEITQNYMSASTDTLSFRNTPIGNLAQTLEAEIRTGEDPEQMITGRVAVAAMEPRSLEPFISKGDIVLVGNREDSQEKLLDAQVQCMVFTCGSRASGPILERARRQGCAVVETKLDTFTTARLINQSLPIGMIMKTKDIVLFHIDDYVDNIREKMLQTRHRSYPVVDADGVVRGFISRYHLITSMRKKVILVDHNELLQAVDGIGEAEILEILDHHRIGDIQTGAPVYFRNDTVGSTATLVAGIYAENGLEPEPELAGILCAAILSDTLNLKSPTATKRDTETVRRLAAIAGIEPDSFAAAMFEAGASLEGMSPRQILFTDFKDFRLGKYKIGVGQVYFRINKGLEHMQETMLPVLREVRDERGYDLLLLLLTDVREKGSQVLFAGTARELTSRLFRTEQPEGSVFLPDVVSRKKQVVPLLGSVIQTI